VIAAQPEMPHLPQYRTALGLFAVGSLVLAVLTPTSWQPLRPAFVTGALSALVVVAVGGRLAERLRPPRPTSGA
jgi:hypothetical protein